MTRNLIVVLVLAVFVSVSAFGQEVPKVDARVLYEQNASQIIQAFQVSASLQVTKGKQRVLRAETAYPGDNAQFAILKLNKEFYEYGDRVVARLIGIQDQGAFTIGGRITFYNNITQQAEVRFFTPEVCGYPGYCPGGLVNNQNIVVYSEEVSVAMQTGSYAVDFIICNADGSGLRQQIFSYYYIGDAPQWGRMAMYADRVFVYGNSVYVEGQFPTNDLVLWAGNIVGGYAAKPLKYEMINGQFVVFSRPFSFGPGDHPVDVVLFSPMMRVSVTIPRAYVAKGEPPTPLVQ